MYPFKSPIFKQNTVAVNSSPIHDSIISQHKSAMLMRLTEVIEHYRITCNNYHNQKQRL